MNPQVLVRYPANLRLDEVVETLGIGDGALAGKILERWMYDGTVSLCARQALEEVGQYRCTSHACKPRCQGVGCSGDTKQLHHLGALLAVTLIGRIPDTLVVFERADQPANIVPRNRAPDDPAAAAGPEAGRGPPPGP